MEHRLILGGAQFLPFARSCITKLKKLGLPYASQSFELDGASIKVRIEPGHEYIRLEGGSTGYQFFATGKTPKFYTDAFGFNIFSGYAVRADREAKAKATGASFEASTDAAKPWRFVTPPEDITSVFARKKIWQIEGITQRVFYGSVGGTLASYPALVNSWCHADPLHTLGILGGSPTNTSLFDVGYDAAPNRFSRNAPSPAGANGLAPDADWYKRAAFRKVIHPEYGERNFIILSDVSGTFYVYPTGETDDTLLAPALAAYPGQALKTNVPDKFVKTARAPWPDWCRAPSVKARDFYRLDGSNLLAYLRAVPQYRWAFNSTATRACAIVFEDLDSLALDDPAATVPSKLLGGVEFPLKESLPGLLELDIDIQITGLKPEEFSFTLGVAQASRPSVAQQYYMAAEYAWDCGLDASLDDLLVAQGEIYHSSGERISTTQRLDLYAHTSRLVVRNLTQVKAVRTFLTFSDNRLYASDTIVGFPVNLPAGENRKVAKALVLAMDLRVLAFVLQQRYIESAVTWNSGIPTEGAYSAAQRVLTYMHNALVDTVVMDPGTALDAALVLAHDATGVTDLSKLPLNQVGHYPPYLSADYSEGHSAYASASIIDLSGIAPTPYENTRAAFLNYGGQFQAGAYLYAELMATAVPLNHRDVFAYAPDGSWSVATGPIFHYAGATTLEGVVSTLDLNQMRQTRIDLIRLKPSLKYKPPAETPPLQDATGMFMLTHLDLFNQAYGKTDSAADYLCAFSLFEDNFTWTDAADGVPGKTVHAYLLARTPAGAALYFFLEGYSQRNDSQTKFYNRRQQPLSFVDARLAAPMTYSKYPKIIGFSGSLLADNSGARNYSVLTEDGEHTPLNYDTATLNGSAYFF